MRWTVISTTKLLLYVATCKCGLVGYETVQLLRVSFTYSAVSQPHAGGQPCVMSPTTPPSASDALISSTSRLLIISSSHRLVPSALLTMPRTGVPGATSKAPAGLLQFPLLPPPLPPPYPNSIHPVTPFRDILPPPCRLLARGSRPRAK